MSEVVSVFSEPSPTAGTSPFLVKERAQKVSLDRHSKVTPINNCYSGDFLGLTEYSGDF
jgi:hypothetical protein